jgi:glycosyltransferase involved in cell wall biosynthesis
VRASGGYVADIERVSHVAQVLGAIIRDWRAGRLIRELNPDIVHLFGLYSIDSPALLPLVYGLPHLVITPWGTDIVYDFGRREPLKSVLVKQVSLRQAACVTSLSHFMTRQVKPYLGKKEIPVEYVPWGVDMEFFHPRYRKSDPSRFTIGITKLFRKKYGHAHLLEAVACLVHQFGIRNIEVVMPGKGELEEELRGKCRTLRIDAHVRFPGYTHDEARLRDHFAGFDVCAMPSIFPSETLGVAAIEASAMELPVIASRIGGIAEVVTHEVTGLLTEPADPRGMAEGLLKLYRHPELRKKMGATARKRVQDAYDFDACAGAMNRCYYIVRRDIRAAETAAASEMSGLESSPFHGTPPQTSAAKFQRPTRMRG